MHIMRLGPHGRERPVVRLDDNYYVEIGDLIGDVDGRFWGSDRDELRHEVAARGGNGRVRAFDNERVGAPIARPHQIICIGLNYADHAAETGQSLPDEPIIFSKSPNTLVGPNDDVRVPRGSSRTDWEVELGIVIGRRARYLDDLDSAREAIGGYVISNDVSERDFQLERGGQWMKGKSAETFNPCGPWLATTDEISDPASLCMWLDVNGVRRQSGSTSTMVFDPFTIVHYLSQFMVLEPGDLINTGTPPGVGMGMTPPLYLKPGDVVGLGIDGLGVQEQRVVAWDGTVSSTRATPSEGAER